ncbi:hypothetical protein DNHGIG_23770 [Collibacillus ludicampi]|uniref:Uncharacterized protein n=1 Tax=Collibacillus ludicampi TaxID=2771369 RepID=A0AAV4LGP3_9BACL|nr:hypothetical protein [Collibacillus ludicampi]GIM46828.1 hypothetical protein DNHGIG_23770 [Collibacillus ludicampi]
MVAEDDDFIITYGESDEPYDEEKLRRALEFVLQIMMEYYEKKKGNESEGLK